MKDFALTRVVTRNMFTDMFQGIRNTFGFRLRGYEKVITRTTTEMLQEMNLTYHKIEFYRFSINPLTTGSIMVTLYGRAKDE